MFTKLKKHNVAFEEVKAAVSLKFLTNLIFLIQSSGINNYGPTHEKLGSNQTTGVVERVGAENQETAFTIRKYWQLRGTQMNRKN